MLGSKKNSKWGVGIQRLTVFAGGGGVRCLLSVILILQLNKFEFSRPPISAHAYEVSIIERENKIP